MELDENGFMYPVVNENDCSKCGLCLENCPENNHETLNWEHIPETCFAAKHKGRRILMQSSSGGAFAAITQCFDDNVIVYGACYDENMRVVHKGVVGKNKYKHFLKSKYVQSNLLDSFSEIKTLIKDGKEVVFSGTPCQIAGLKCYLGNVSQGLFCVEILCHGVASPSVFSDYIKYLEYSHKSKVANFIFRDKRRGRGMWREFLTTIEFENGKKICDRYDLYTLGYLSGLFARESCLTCPYTKSERVGDIVIGDYWGLEKYRPDFCSNSGVSLVIPITHAGRNLMEKISQYMQITETPISWATAGNRVLSHPTKVHPIREHFYKLYQKYPIDKAMAECIHRPSLIQRMILILPINLRILLKKMRSCVKIHKIAR